MYYAYGIYNLINLRVQFGISKNPSKAFSQYRTTTKRSTLSDDMKNLPRHAFVLFKGAKFETIQKAQEQVLKLIECSAFQIYPQSIHRNPNKRAVISIDPVTKVRYRFESLSEANLHFDNSKNSGRIQNAIANKNVAMEYYWEWDVT